MSQIGLGSRPSAVPAPNQASGVARQGQTPHLVPPKSGGAEAFPINTQIPGLSPEQNQNLVREVAELAAMAATVAARETTGTQRKVSTGAPLPPRPTGSQQPRTYNEDPEDATAGEDAVASCATGTSLVDVFVFSGGVPPLEAVTVTVLFNAAEIGIHKNINCRILGGHGQKVIR